MANRRLPEEPRPVIDRNRISVIFVDQKNELQSQLAEFYTNQLFPEIYQAFSAGPESDIVDCDMIISLFEDGQDIRRQRSKTFDSEFLPEENNFDFVVYTHRSVFEEYADKTIWKGRQILAEMGTKEDFTATDDKELSEEYLEMAERIKQWVKDNMSDPENLKKLVSA